MPVIMDVEAATALVEAELATLTPEQRQEMLRMAIPRMVEPYVKHIPHPPQQVFLSLYDREVLFGGAAGGGKSDALLMSALQYVDVPYYSALILRRTWPDLNERGAILDRARQWLGDTPARERDGGRKWVFPSGATLSFGYVQHDKDKHKFDSAEFQFVGWDELTQFSQDQYEWISNSRVRRPQIQCLNCNTALGRYRNQTGVYYKHKTKKGKEFLKSGRCAGPWPDPKSLAMYRPAPDGTTLFDVPLRVRSATNPGNVGHVWVRDRFIDPETRDPLTVFIPSLLQDNPSLDEESYRAQLEGMSPIARERLLRGDWDIMQEGLMFQRHWFEVVDHVPNNIQYRVRRWDLAASVTDAADWTAGALVSFAKDGTWYIEDIVRVRARPHEVEALIAQTALVDGRYTPIRMEEEGGSAGKNVISHYQRHVLPGYNFAGVRSTGSKEARAVPVSIAAEQQMVKMVKSQIWNKVFLDELSLFPQGEHDDMVDAVAGAFFDITGGSRVRIIV